MLFGHNTDVKVGDAVYHVQTEDRGAANALIDTTVYCRGRVLHRRTNNYIDLLPLSTAHEDSLRTRIDDQHRAVTEEIRSGALKLIPPPAPAKGDGAPQKPAAAPSNPVLPNAGNKAPEHSTSTPPTASSSSVLGLELLNPKTWLTGKHASLHIAVRDKQTGIVVAGAKVIAHVEGAASGDRFTANTGLDGLAKLEFEMPHVTAAEAALVIEVTQANAKGHLKFQLRARARVPTA